MITLILGFLWMIAILVPLIKESKLAWIVWLLSSLIWITTISTGLPIENSQGQYKGFVTAVEKNGTLFKGWTAYLRTELESSNEDIACINRDNQELIERLKTASEKKENLTLEYRGKIQFPIGECPGSDWMIVRIK